MQPWSRPPHGKEDGEVIGRHKPKMRRLIVDPKAQIALFASMATTSFLAISIFEICLSLSTGESAAPFWMIFFMGVGGFAIVTIMQFRLSNRIFGPLYRLNQHMMAAANGGPIQGLTAREGDLLGETLSNYNQVLARLREAESAKHSNG